MAQFFLILSLYLFLLLLLLTKQTNSMKSTNNDGDGGRGVIMIPNSGKYSNVLIFMHGLGDTADGWASMMPSLNLHDTKFILPTASSIPISINGGARMPGWFDIYELSMAAKEDRDGFAKSSNRIKSIIQKELDNGIDSNKIIIGGFSQGGAVALHVSLRAEYQLGGCVALSTWLPFKDDFPEALSESSKKLSLFQAHGSADNVVSFKWSHSSSEVLKSMIKGI
jgi:lysophospholipase-2